jgi:hypothetical protein
MIVIQGELYSSKNSKQIINRGGRNYLIPSTQYNSHLKPIQWQLALFKGKWLEETKHACKPFEIAFKIYRKTQRRFDYINIIQGLADEMVRAGWLVDDNADEFLPIFLPYEVDKNNPRVEIFIINQ